MPVTLALRFPWGRYHATPWGHYVNEGLVEIPPSPWRILRALYSVWRLRAPDLDADTVHSLLAKLADTPPQYTLPPYQVSHTRHYLPDTKHRTGKLSSDLALDAFAALSGDATIRVHWLTTALTPEEHKALDRLATSLPYMGRADSLCEAFLEEAKPLPDASLAFPLLAPEDRPPGTKLVKLLAPEIPLNLNALIAEVADTRKAKLVYPPGSQLLPYAVPGTQRPQQARRQRRRREPEKITAVRLSLDGLPQPRATDTVAVTDALRAACLKALASVQEGRPAGFSNLIGKDSDGNPLRDHQHAHYLGLPDANGYLSSLAIWAPGGLSDDELAALSRLANRTIGVPKDVRGPRNLQVRVNAYGNLEPRSDTNSDPTRPEILPSEITGPSTTWTSVTPFVPSRWRPRQTSSEDHTVNEVHRELQARGLLTPTKVTLLPQPEWALFRRHRWSPHHRAGTSTKTVGTRINNRPAFGLRLDFAEPVPGPLALGDLSHFGLGLFKAP